jgi:hypothetical protein
MSGGLNLDCISRSKSRRLRAVVDRSDMRQQLSPSSRLSEKPCTSQPQSEHHPAQWHERKHPKPGTEMP